MNIEKVLRPKGKFYATFFQNPQGKFNLEPIEQSTIDDSNVIKSFLDADPYHYGFETFKWICKSTSLKAKYIGDWNQPRGQMMMVFTKRTWF